MNLTAPLLLPLTSKWPIDQGSVGLLVALPSTKEGFYLMWSWFGMFLPRKSYGSLCFTCFAVKQHLVKSVLFPEAQCCSSFLRFCSAFCLPENASISINFKDLGVIIYLCVPSSSIYKSSFFPSHSSWILLPGAHYWELQPFSVKSSFSPGSVRALSSDSVCWTHWLTKLAPNTDYNFFYSTRKIGS